MTEEPVPPAPICLIEPTPIWSCKIGTRQPGVTLPHPADPPMRAAVKKAFREITGVDAEFTFSGWSAELDEGELMVLGDYSYERTPRMTTIALTPDSPRLAALADAFQALTYREMIDLSEVMAEALEGTNGLKVKPAVFAEVLDTLGSYLVIEAGSDQ